MMRPINITANRTTSEFFITWTDEHQSVINFSLLRNACPCAECRGGHDLMRTTPDPEVFTMPIEDKPETRLVAVQPVGSYAITIEWEDGHHYGIYRWDYLRALCQCEICSEKTT